MKGKVLSLKIVLCLLVLVTAGFCFGIGVLPKSENKVFAASTKVSLNTDGEQEEYSALMNGNIIFSVEKVLVGNYGAETLDAKVFQGTDKDTGNAKEYYFKNIQNGTQNKTVIDNGQFAVMNNILENNKIVHPSSSDEREAIMVSFGAYVYTPDDNTTTNMNEENVTIADSDKNSYSPITYLDVKLERNGVSQTLPNNRNINISNGATVGLFFDFVCLIEQDINGDNEGYYKFTINYMVGNVEYQEEFEFYVVNKLSYTQSSNESLGYNASPTLGWTGSDDFEQTADSDGYVKYYIGESGISDTVAYPTITYDYTKYSLSFVHTANQKNTTYVFETQYNNTLSKQTAVMNYTATSNSEVSSGTFSLSEYVEGGAINLVTIMLTEPGTYTFSYDLIYDGYNSETAPDEIGIEKRQIRLSIHGLLAKYSKTDYDSANLQYFSLATKKENNVDLFVLHGYDINSSDINNLQGKKLGFVYDLVESEEREGNLVAGIDSLINAELKKANYYDLVVNNISNIQNYETFEPIADNVDEILNGISYAETNQGSLWIEGNDAYTTNSFYYYSATKIDKNSLFKVETIADEEVYKTTLNKFTNTTSFKAKGYYLVFLEITPDDNELSKYWQIFAMRYTSSSVNIEIKTEDGDIIAGGKYTKENVTVAWKEPGVFDREISGYYYKIVNNNASKEELQKTTKLALNAVENNGYFTASLGSEVEQGSFVKYLIKLESEGESATYKIFTIDRQAISGVQPFLIEEMHSGNSVFYAYATDVNNYYVPINSSITDGYATITWDDKASGAETYASYNFTPFVQNGNKSVATTGANGKTWLTTNYELGSTISGYSLSKPVSPYNVQSDNILFNQGIYIIRIWDSAGNECYYSFVIDRTENYFEIENTSITNDSVIYGDDVSFNVGDYKAFQLPSENVDSDVLDFIEKASSSKLAEFKNGLYYTGTYSNVNTITKYFQKVGDFYYFTVKNTKVLGYDSFDNLDSLISGLNGELSYYVVNEGSYVRTLYVVAENHTSINIISETHPDYNQRVKNNAFVTIEINKDNARGMVYYSSDVIDNLPNDGGSTGTVKRLLVGSDNENGNGVEGAHATSASNVAFVWNMGTGNFEVAKVSYTFYSLNFNNYDEKFYFYNNIDRESFDIYNEGTFYNGATALGDGRAFINFNGNDESRAGLYVVTREYKDDDSIDLGDDVKVRNYYFIVDRNEIIDLSQGIGEQIKLYLLENETEFNDFSISGTETEIVSTDDFENQRYNIYLNTTKLPVNIQVPVGKYLDATHASSYNAGKLNVSVYFNDIYNQLTGKYSGSVTKIFDSNATEISKNQLFYEIDIYEYLSRVNTDLRDRITESSSNGTWLFLSGDYIIRITDNVMGDMGQNHSKFIGFRINAQADVGPQVESKTGYKQDSMSKIVVSTDSKFNYSATVSQEYLEVVLPKYDSSVIAKAQVDPNYLVVTQNYDGNVSDYVNYPYYYKSGFNLTDYSLGISTLNEDGTISVWLDTKLRDANNNIDLENLNTPLYYTITVRYKIGDGSSYEKYKNCYKYYSNGEVKYFYEATYVISIDREAPTANIDALNKEENDAFVKEYNDMFGTDSMISNGVHETTSNLYFTKQYTKYYETEKANKGYIYAYQVDSTTVFNASDVEYVYFKEIGDLSSYNLTLPLINESDYTKMRTSQFSGYKGLNLNDNKYYEIIEQDGAGNTTQYVIHYSPSKPEVSIPVSVITTQGDINKLYTFELSEGNLGYKDPINIYDINAGESQVSSANNAKFIKIELQRSNGGEEVLQILTTSTTDFSKINQQIVDVLKEEKVGNFNLIISARQVNSGSGNVIVESANINLYDNAQVISINIEDLVETEKVGDEEKYFINLAGANKFNADNTLLYFAIKIKIQSSNSDTVVYCGKFGANGVYYYLESDPSETPVNTRIECGSNTTYYLEMTDGLGKVSKYRFNTNGQDFYDILFENPEVKGEFGEFYYQSEADKTYYGYTSATVKYDNIFTAKYFKKENEKYVKVENFEIRDVGDNYRYIDILADYKNPSLIEVRIDLYADNNEFELSYYVVINTKLESVALRSSSGEQRDIIEIFNNKNYTDESVRANRSGAGIMNLQWNKVEDNEYFDYVYTLHELKKDGSYYSQDFTDVTNYVVSTGSDSKGIYKFEIKVYGKNGIYLGNRIFAFEVQEVSSQIYYVRKGEEAIGANSSFKLSDLPTSARDTMSGLISENVSLPLFVSNEELTLVLTAVQVEDEIIVDFSTLDYSFKIFKISKKDAYDIYLGFLNVGEKQQLVKQVNIGNQTVNEITSLTIAGEPSDEVVLKASKIEPATNDGLIAKNLLMLDVYYNGENVKTVKNYSGNFTVDGNGQYSFVIKDLAGNVHQYENGETLLESYVLREVVVTINDEAPITNGFYNDAVNLAIYASTKYVTGSISLVAYKNGEEYVPTGYNPYVFSEFGTYRVVINANYNDGTNIIPLSKIVTFTIINVKEARKSIDLTSLNGSTITKVTNTYGEDKTEEFLNVLNSSNGGMNITYANVIKYANELNVTAGKITFTITYVVSDGIYPDRSVDFSFTLNNENPVIECSLEKGEKTTKEFKIYFNPAILYAQIGEAYVYINDEIVAHINESSQNSETTITTSFKSDGDGDYYIKLVGTSGVVWDSYKVTIKEPLNFWAIIVIVVVVAVVATVVITIIVLRRKMRIR